VKFREAVHLDANGVLLLRDLAETLRAGGRHLILCEANILGFTFDTIRYYKAGTSKSITTFLFLIQGLFISHTNLARIPAFLLGKFSLISQKDTCLSSL
jgi:hypothetical protein